MHNQVHIAIIMDGNRRYASRLGEISYRGHFYGADVVENLIEWSFDLGISHLTLYAFSIENFEREEREKAEIFRLITTKFDELRCDERIHKNRIKINAIGLRWNATQYRTRIQWKKGNRARPPEDG